MSQQVSSETVWNVLEKELFAVLGMVTAKGEARTIGVVYIVKDQRIYIVTGDGTWKARHIRTNPHVSITVPIAKRIPLLPWIKIPAATITFAGQGSVLEPENVDKEILHSLLRGLEADPEVLGTMCVIQVQPIGEFITYGVGVPLMSMRDPEKARGRVPIG
jgi:hypothetical protein